MKRVLSLLGGLTVGLLLAGGVMWLRDSPAAPVRWYGGVVDPPVPVGDMALTRADGSPFRLSDYRGRVVLVYFGYASCPDVCPATLADVARAVDEAGADAAGVQVVFVTVDPLRDTPARVAAYAASFDPAFIGLSGTPEEIAAAGRPLGIRYEKVTGGDDTAYFMNHTSIVHVIDSQGRLRLIWPFGVKSAEMAADLRQLLR